MWHLMTQELHIVGGGMAGSEAAWQAANMGVKVVLHEMRPTVETFAHQTGNLGEMVCSNSFRSDDDEQNAVGLLHWEMRAAKGLIMTTADKHRLPAGGALAVDREPVVATTTALAYFGLAGEKGAIETKGPGSFQMAILDALYTIDEKQMEEGARIQS